MPKLYKRGDVWHYSFTVEGERIRRSAGTPDKRLATDAAIEHERRERRAAVHGAESVVTFSAAVADYMAAGGETRYLLAALDHFKDTLISRITPEMIREAAVALYPHAGPATRNRQAITPIQAVINRQADMGRGSPIRVRRFPVQRKERPAGDKHWLAAFQSGARQNSNPSIAALARLMFETGARIGQACALVWEDIDLGGRAVTLRTRKTGRGGGVWERKAHLTSAMVAELANLPGDRYRVFGYRTRNSAYKAWKAAIATAKLSKMTPHEAGRHGFGTEMVTRNKIDIPTAADAGGWKSRRLMLDVYSHSEGAAAAVESVFGTPASHGKRKRRQSGEN